MSRSKVLTVALVVVLVLLAGWSLFKVRGVAAGSSYPNENKYTVGGGTVSGTVENLIVDWTSGQVNIEYHKGGDFIISETANRDLSEDDRLRWWLDGTTLRIRYAKSGLRINFNLDKKLTVSLPEGTVLKAADIGTTSADILVPGLAADEIRLGSTSGSISAVTVTEKLTASSTSGGITVEQKTDVGAVDLGSTSGSISCVLGGNASSVTASSTSGSISLAVAGSVETVDIGSTSGCIYPDLASVGKAEFGSTSGCVSGSVSAFRDLKVGTTSGTVSLKLPTDPGFTCRVDTASGSFSSGLALTRSGNTYTCGDGTARCSINTSSGNILIEEAE